MHVQVIRVGRKRRLSPDKIERRGLGDPFQTVIDIERRLLRACRTLRALPDPDKKFQWVGSAWPEMVRSTEEAYGYSEAIMPRFRPTPVDVSDYLTALSWARMIPWEDFRLVWWRSFDLSFGQIAMRIHKTDETARRRYRDVLLKIWHAFNYTQPKRAAG
jgi:hypothetical protein